jgi:hypothetical protein
VTVGAFARAAEGREVRVPASIVVVIVSQMFFTSFLLFLVAGFVRDRARRRSELQMRLMDRFGSAPELLAYLESEEGQRLREAITGRRFLAVRQVLGAIQVGIVLIALGGGLLVAAIRQGDGDMMVAAAVCASVGVGLLVAALITKRLSVGWHVWTEDSQAGPR